MNKRLIASAAASGVLAFMTIGHAMAGGAHPVAPGMTVVERGKTPLGDLVMNPGTDPSSVQVHFAGAQGIRIAYAGVLEITKADGSTWRYRPVAYQVVNGKRHGVIAGFQIIGKDRVALRVQRFDPSAPVVFGPVDASDGRS